MQKFLGKVMIGIFIFYNLLISINSVMSDNIEGKMGEYVAYDVSGLVLDDEKNMMAEDDEGGYVSGEDEFGENLDENLIDTYMDTEVVSDKDGGEETSFGETIKYDKKSANTSLLTSIQNDVVLLAGPKFNLELKKLTSGNLGKIKAIKRFDGVEISPNSVDISDAGDRSIVAWLDGNTIYYYVNGNVVMNSDSSSMFNGCNNLEDIDILSTWDTSNVINFWGIFQGCKNLEDVSALKMWDTTKVENMESMFYGCENIKIIDLPWNTSKVSLMKNMFQDCYGLQEIMGIENWDTSNVTNMKNMFYKNYKLKKLNLSSWDTSKVKDMGGMFYKNYELETIFVSKKFRTDEVSVKEEGIRGRNMFTNDYLLVGGNGTNGAGNWDDPNVNIDYAKIDIAGQSGYFTSVDPIVTFWTNGSENGDFALVVGKGETIDRPVVELVREHSTFGNYYSDKSLTQIFDFSSPIFGDTIVYSKYVCEEGYREASDGQSCIEIEKDGTKIQDLNLYFVDGYANVIHYVIMDRNMGATDIFNQRFDDQNENSFGNYYQWGNNYGFPYEGIVNNTIASSYQQVPYDVWSIYEPSTYSSGVYILNNSNWHGGATISNSNLWGGKGDDLYFNGIGTKQDRQGPCPEGYYVPSVYDWSSVLNGWRAAAKDGNDYRQYARDLLLPLAGDIGSTSLYLQNMGDGLYWTSSSQGGNNGYRMMLRNEFNGFRIGNYNKSLGQNVRCFKNNFKNEGISSSFKIYSNGGTGAVISIDEDIIISLGVPTRNNDEFLGWYTTPDFQDGTKVSVGDNIAGTDGLYAKWEYIVKFVDDNGTLITSTGYVKGTSKSVVEANKPADPSKVQDVQYTYDFDGWTPAFEDVTRDITYTAKYIPTLRFYSVTFLDEDGTVLKDTKKYPYGTHRGDLDVPEDPYKPNIPSHSYAFDGWNPEEHYITGDVIYRAKYIETTNKYEVHRKDGNGHTIHTEALEYGTMPDYQAHILNGWPVPEKHHTAQYSYEFNNKWSPEIQSVTGNITYTAQFDEILNQYTIKFVDDGGVVLSSAKYDYGTIAEDIVVPVGMSKDDDEKYQYVFVGWSPSISDVLGDATYTAVYDAVEIKIGNGGSKLKRDYCPDGDYSDSYYDGNCGAPDKNSDIDGKGETKKCGEGSIGNCEKGYGSAGEENNYTDEELSAYEWAYKNGITTKNTMQDANPNGYVLRGHMAKMVVKFFENVLGKGAPKDIPEECLRLNNGAVGWESQEIQGYAMRACAHGIMGIDMEGYNFLADHVVTRAEFGTIVSRILRGDIHNISHTEDIPYYTKHLEQLKEHGYMQQIQKPLLMKEFRKWVRLVFKRVSEG